MNTKILCACERTQVLQQAWRKAGFDAWSCDLDSCYGLDPEHHIQGDCFAVLADFDYVFAFPPCTHLSYANGAHLAEKISDGRTAAAVKIFYRLYKRHNVVMLENPLGIIGSLIPYTQIVSPDDFGSSKKKRTCLWLKGLPPLLPTTCRAGKSYIQSLSSGSFRRSELDPFLAAAMVDQWSDYVQ